MFHYTSFRNFGRNSVFLILVLSSAPAWAAPRVLTGKLMPEKVGGSDDVQVFVNEMNASFGPIPLVYVAPKNPGRERSPQGLLQGLPGSGVWESIRSWWSQWYSGSQKPGAPKF